MNAVSPVLLLTIKELQQLPSLKESRLGGGTSLALRYDHRESVDIDLLFSGIIGRSGFQQIEKEVRAKFGEAILHIDYPCDQDDQFIFLRFLVRKGAEQIKVEIMQNMIFTEDANIVEGVNVLSCRDIGMLKLMAVSNRCSFKDVYDLTYLTEEIALSEFFDLLAAKQKKYSGKEYHTIFDLDNEVSPVIEPKRLMYFEAEAESKQNRPAHSTNKFKIVNGISWLGAKVKWRRRVNQLLREVNQH